MKTGVDDDEKKMIDAGTRRLCNSGLLIADAVFMDFEEWTEESDVGANCCALSC